MGNKPHDLETGASNAADMLVGLLAVESVVEENSGDWRARLICCGSTAEAKSANWHEPYPTAALLNIDLWCRQNYVKSTHRESGVTW